MNAIWDSTFIVWVLYAIFLSQYIKGTMKHFLVKIAIDAIGIKFHAHKDQHFETRNFFEILKLYRTILKFPNLIKRYQYLL